MTDPVIVVPKVSPLALFREQSSRGAIAVSSTEPAGRAFPPRLSLSTLEDMGTRAVRAGVVYSATRVETRACAYVIALIDLHAGGRLLARLRCDAAPEAMIGEHVTLVANRSENEPFLTFEKSSVGEGA